MGVSEYPSLALYVHYPWCIKKCPYCDFNSHNAEHETPENNYIEALIRDLDFSLSLIEDRPVQSIFFGGGTPSLISGEGMITLLEQLAERLHFADSIEITLEANPGTMDADHFKHYHSAGVNRLSIGVQSFRDPQLSSLGRIHSSDEVLQAYELARKAGFANINLDLMFGLPDDTLAGALSDLKTAIDLKPEHLSWYQLTLEPNTLFYHQPPALPEDDQCWEIQTEGQSLLKSAGYQQYEISAYAKNNHQCQHNENYWKFGDYLGIGAGAHSKITLKIPDEILRFSKLRLPRHYMENAGSKEMIIGQHSLSTEDICLEFPMNVLRLNEGFSIDDFESNTGQSITSIEQAISRGISRKLLIKKGSQIQPTDKGRLFLNDLLALFSEDSAA